MTLANNISIVEDITKLESEYSQKSPQEILAFALKQFDNITISFSGAEDVVLIDMASKIKKDIKVFSIDTGRLHPETYQFIDRIRKQYRVKIDVISPDAAEVEALVKEKGLFSFYQDGHKECCAIRKVKPLRRKLKTVKAWITGQRKDQNPATRNSVPVIQVDTAFSTDENTLIKFKPNIFGQKKYSIPLMTTNILVSLIEHKSILSMSIPRRGKVVTVASGFNRTMKLLVCGSLPPSSRLSCKKQSIRVK